MCRRNAILKWQLFSANLAGAQSNALVVVKVQEAADMRAVAATKTGEVVTAHSERDQAKTRARESAAR